MIELKILLTALVVWAITHHLQFAALRVNADVVERWGYKLCVYVRLFAIAVTAVSFLVWVWRHMPTVFRALCTM